MSTVTNVIWVNFICCHRVVFESKIVLATCLLFCFSMENRVLIYGRVVWCYSRWWQLFIYRSPKTGCVGPSLLCRPNTRGSVTRSDTDQESTPLTSSSSFQTGHSECTKWRLNVTTNSTETEFQNNEIKCKGNQKIYRDSGIGWATICKYWHPFLINLPIQLKITPLLQLLISS